MRFTAPESVCALFHKPNKDYLEEDDRYTILMTPHGYTIMEWDTSHQNWASAELCATPEQMRDLLLDDLACYLEYKVTLCNRSLEDNERQMIQRQVAKMESLLQ